MLHSLIERDEELVRAELALHDASAGSGRVLVITGPPGIGKTALLRAVRARQLLEPPLAAMSTGTGKRAPDRASVPALELLGLLPVDADWERDGGSHAARRSSPMPGWTRSSGVCSG